MPRPYFFHRSVSAVLLAAAALAQPLAATGTASIEQEIVAAKAAMMGDPATALTHALNIAKIVEFSGSDNVEDQLIALWLQGEALTRLNRAGEALPLLETALRRAEKDRPDTKLHGDLLKAYAAAARVMERSVDALNALHAAHRIFETAGEDRARAIVLQNLGMLHIEARDYDRALQYFDQADAAAKDDVPLLIGSHTNRGRIYEEIDNGGRAVRSYQAALKLAEQLKSTLLRARITTNLAFAELRRGEIKNAEILANRALALDGAADGTGRPFLLALKARLELLRGETGRAVQLVDEAFSGVDTRTTSGLFLEAHDAARNVYRTAGLPGRALPHYEAHERLEQEATRIAANLASALTSARFDAANRELQIAQLESENLKREDERRRSQSNVERLTLAALALFGVAGLGYAGQRARMTRRRHREMSQMNKQLVHAAQHDSLTDLPNRVRCYNLVERSMSADKLADRRIWLLMIDLDEFKEINDGLGHHAGDAVLKEIAARLNLFVNEHQTAGRLGGDEFVFLCDAGVDSTTAKLLASEVIAAVQQPISLPEGQVAIGCSIGIAGTDTETPDPDALFRNADLAMYAAKDAGRGCYAMFDEAMLAAAEARRRLLVDLKDALGNGEFEVHYQPIVGREDDRIVAYEALIRWQHPEHGRVSPADFIPLAEDAGLIPEIGGWVLKTACMAAARLNDDTVIAVNVSPLQFDDSLSSRVLNALAASGLPPTRLQLEVTESVFMKSAERTAAELSRLAAIGVSLAIDDFGTGYSSLGYLQRADFSKIKIDRSFVIRAGEGCNESREIIRAIVALANSLGMVTTAEGIETPEQAALLRNYGVTQMQGYLFGKPGPLDEGQKLQCAEKSQPALPPPGRRAA